jgi:hypothetical protein
MSITQLLWNLEKISRGGESAIILKGEPLARKNGKERRA